MQLTQMLDRRRSDRHPISIPVSVSSVDGPDRTGVLDNLSDTGLLFHSRSRFQVGERLSVVFHEGTLRRDVTGRVVRTSLVDTDGAFFQHVTGIRFESGTRSP
jgi:hypothetical protein